MFCAVHLRSAVEGRRFSLRTSQKEQHWSWMTDSLSEQGALMTDPGGKFDAAVNVHVDAGQHASEHAALHGSDIAPSGWRLYAWPLGIACGLCLIATGLFI